MPQSITIGAFIFGAILVLIAILGGNFKLFGAEIATTISNPFLRFLAFMLGVVFLLISIAGNNPNPPPPTPTPTPTTSNIVPNYQPVMGAYCCDVSGMRRCPLIKPLPLGESCFCPYQGLGFTCQ
jgi:hypothetical protein